MAFGDIVQSAYARESIFDEVTVTLPSSPTVGNTLVLWHAVRSDEYALGPSGWTAHPSGRVYASDEASDVYNGAFFYRVVQSGDWADIICPINAGGGHIAFIAEFEGVGVVDSYAESQFQSGASLTVSVTPTAASDPVIFGGFVVRITDTSNQYVTPTGSTTEILDQMTGTGTPRSPLSFVGHRKVTGASGAYTITGTCTASRPWGAQAIAFTVSGGGGGGDPDPEPEPDAEPGFWMDFARDGFDDGSGPANDDPLLARMLPQAAAVGTAAGGDNITAYVMRADWYRGASYDHVGSSGPGGFTLLLDNRDGRWDPDNTAGPYYGLLTPGVPVWAGAIRDTGALSGAGTVAGFIAGRVREYVPTVDASGRRVCEVIGEDALATYSTSFVSLEPSLARSHNSLRQEVLLAMGEEQDRLSLPDETGMMPFSAVETESGLSVLEELNRATASRHFIRPADSKEDWYQYLAVNKLHRLMAAEDQAITGDDIASIGGWRVTNDNVIEVQRATIEPISVTSVEAVVWEYNDIPLTVTNTRGLRVVAEFDDYVFDPDLDYNVSSGSVTYVLTAYGRKAEVAIWSTTSSATIGQLRILGRQVVRGDALTVVAGDADTPGAKAGSTISSDYIGQMGAAQGLVDFIIWKFGQPLKRPTFTIEGKNAATFEAIFQRDLFDVVTLSVDKLSLTTPRRLELIGVRGQVYPAANPPHYSVTFEAQETPNQSAIAEWFVVDTDGVDGFQFIAPF